MPSPSVHERPRAYADRVVNLVICLDFHPLAFQGALLTDEPALGRTVETRTHLINGAGIRPAMHPVWLRCSSVKYSRYSRSSRLARRAPRRPRCYAPIYEMGSTVEITLLSGLDLRLGVRSGT